MSNPNIITAKEEAIIDVRDKIIQSALSGQYQDAYDALSSYASQVSDKRAEELRAMVDRLLCDMKRIECISSDRGVHAITRDAIEAIAATEPKPTRDDFKRFEKRSGITTDVDD